MAVEGASAGAAGSAAALVTMPLDTVKTIHGQYSLFLSFDPCCKKKFRLSFADVNWASVPFLQLVWMSQGQCFLVCWLLRMDELGSLVV